MVCNKEKRFQTFELTGNFNIIAAAAVVIED
jgi:hypothetical protein